MELEFGTGGSVHYTGGFFPCFVRGLFLWRGSKCPKQIFLVNTADGGGKPQKSFIGLFNGAVFDSVNRFAFTFLSSEKNPVKYWMAPNDTQGFTLGIQTFFPTHPDKFYIEVISEFTPAPVKDVEFFSNTPFLDTLFMVQKGILMRDLLQAYYPKSNLEQLWTDVGALNAGDDPIIKWLEAHGLEGVVDISAWISGWIEKPTVSETLNTQAPAAPTNLVIK